jgi:hypothetical protein
MDRRASALLSTEPMIRKLRFGICLRPDARADREAGAALPGHDRKGAGRRARGTRSMTDSESSAGDSGNGDVDAALSLVFGALADAALAPATLFKDFHHKQRYESLPTFARRRVRRRQSSRAKNRFKPPARTRPPLPDQIDRRSVAVDQACCGASACVKQAQTTMRDSSSRRSACKVIVPRPNHGGFGWLGRPDSQPVFLGAKLLILLAYKLACTPQMYSELAQFLNPKKPAASCPRATRRRLKPARSHIEELRDLRPRVMTTLSLNMLNRLPCETR